jgi:hypothetical protein
VKGRLCVAISSTATATPVANKPNAREELLRLSLCIIAIARKRQTACTKIPVSRHAPYYWPYVLALLIGLLLIICLPELSLTIPRSAGFVR